MQCFAIYKHRQSRFNIGIHFQLLGAPWILQRNSWEALCSVTWSPLLASQSTVPGLSFIQESLERSRGYTLFNTLPFSNISYFHLLPVHSQISCSFNEFFQLHDKNTWRGYLPLLVHKPYRSLVYEISISLSRSTGTFEKFFVNQGIM